MSKNSYALCGFCSLLGLTVAFCGRVTQNEAPITDGGSSDMIAETSGTNDVNVVPDSGG